MRKILILLVLVGLALTAPLVADYLSFVLSTTIAALLRLGRKTV